MPTSMPVRIGRRAFLHQGTLFLAAAAVGARPSGNVSADESPDAEILRVGLITDLHYADKPPAGTRHYRETLGKLAEAATRFEQEQPAFVVELGDFIDSANSVDVEQGYLQRINREFLTLSKDRHYVLGNHCVDMLTKAEFLDAIERPQSYYSFDRGGFHFVVLDACFRGDGMPYGRKNSRWDDANVPAAEVEWLRGDLAATEKKTVVFTHQRLDVVTQHGIKNAAEIRKELEASGKVLAVFQGHSHQNDYKEIAGIHYTTLVAMVEGSGAESNGYSMLDLRSDGGLHLHGFRKQKAYDWVMKS